MAKILLDSVPDLMGNKCPLMYSDICNVGNCRLTKNECNCVGGYYDPLSFNFKKCPFCKVK